MNFIYVVPNKIKRFFDRQSSGCFLLSLAGLFFFLVIMNIGLYPSVFADEYTYSKFSRLMPLSDSTIPGYLYLKVYSFTSLCGDEFLGCAKIINSFLFVMAAPFIFLIARKIANEKVAFYVALLAILGPISSYTAYFMPESFYFLSFWVSCWYLLCLDYNSKSYRWFLAGAIYGISSLIKPHALLYLPAIVFYIVFIFFRVKSLFSKPFCITLSSFLGGLILAKFSISYIFAGVSGLTIFGPFYGSTVSSVSSSGLDKYINLLQLSFESIKGHVFILALIYGLPLTLGLITVWKAISGGDGKNKLDSHQAVQYEKLSFLSLIIILNLICVTALFTASVVGAGPYETPYRLHMRYYNFALPFFYLIAAGNCFYKVKNSKTLYFIFGGALTVLGLYVLYNGLEPYTPSHVDSPEVRGLLMNKTYFLVIGIFSILAISFFYLKEKVGTQLYLYIALPLFVLVSAHYIRAEQNNRFKQDVYDKAGLFTKQYLTDEEISKVVIIGSEPGPLFRALYYLDNANASLEFFNSGSDYDLSNLPAGKEWVLAIGDHDVNGKNLYKIQMNGFILARSLDKMAIDFKKYAWPGIVKRVKGLSTPEVFGTWSSSDVVEFEFANTLPKKFEIHLNAHAFGPNVGKGIKVSIGDDSAVFTLIDTDEQKIIRLKNINDSNVIRFKVPNAISPKELGLSADVRKLGIAFIEMKIVAIE